MPSSWCHLSHTLSRNLHKKADSFWLQCHPLLILVFIDSGFFIAWNPSLFIFQAIAVIDTSIVPLSPRPFQGPPPTAINVISLHEELCPKLFDWAWQSKRISVLLVLKGVLNHWRQSLGDNCEMHVLSCSQNFTLLAAFLPLSPFPTPLTCVSNTSQTYYLLSNLCLWVIPCEQKLRH